MPGLSGIEVIRFIRSHEDFRDSSHWLFRGAETQLIDAVNTGDVHTSNPFSNDALISNVNNLIGNITLLGG